MIIFIQYIYLEKSEAVKPCSMFSFPPNWRKFVPKNLCSIFSSSWHFLYWSLSFYIFSSHSPIKNQLPPAFFLSTSSDRIALHIYVYCIISKNIYIFIKENKVVFVQIAIMWFLLFSSLPEKCSLKWGLIKTRSSWTALVSKEKIILKSIVK